jgi:hypothetical protein
MKSCKNCKFFHSYGKEPKNANILFRFQHVRGFCMDSENKTFNRFAQLFGRGLNWKDYFFKTEGCRFKKSKIKEL